MTAPDDLNALAIDVIKWMDHEAHRKPPFEKIRCLAEYARELAAIKAGDSVVVPRAFIDFVKRAPVSSGCCMCGDPENHPFTDHDPVEMWSYYVNNWLSKIAAAPKGTK